jgi:predicted nucleic-acid-binding protein
LKITADNNLLVRVVTRDDPRQSRLAEAALESADVVILTLPALCELVWVLFKLYKTPPAGAAFAIRRLIGGANVTIDDDAVNAGLAMLDAGGDFADGVIAVDGRRMGGEVFLSFDRQAVAKVRAYGAQARLLA